MDVVIVKAAMEHGPMVRGRYLHWDEVRRRKPPGNLSHEDWWASLKVARHLVSRPISGLVDRAGRAFRYSPIDPIAESLHHIDLGAGGSVELPADITDERTRDRYIVSSLIEESVTSSLLEGAATTRRVATQMLRSRRQPRNRGERMVLNNFVAMRTIQEWRDQPMSPEQVLELHEILTDETLDDADDAGRLRGPDRSIVVADEYGTVLHDPPAAEELADRMSRMCQFANGDGDDSFLHPVARAIILHFWLAYDHPFVDGNGRTARALFYWAMLRSGYWLFEFVSISPAILAAPARYYRSFLHVETDGNDLTYFVIHQLAVIERAIAALHDYLRRKTDEVRESEESLREMDALNHRQKALVAHALRHAEFEYTIASHRGSHRVSYETARSDLLDLTERGLLRKSRDKRRFVFRPAPRLTKRLGKR